MYQEYSEVLKTIGIFVGPLLVFAAALGTIRREAAKAAAPPNVGPGGLIAIGGAFADKQAMQSYTETQEEMSRAIKGLTKANVKVGEEQVEAFTRIETQMRRIADASQEILDHLVHQARKHDRQEFEDRGKGAHYPVGNKNE